MNPRGYSLLALACSCVAAGNLGQGTYIYLKAQLAQQLLRQAWAKRRAGEAEPRPWPWADMSPVAQLRIPKYGVDVFVLSGDSGRTLAFGPGHAPESAALDEPGTSIISAHRDTHFRVLRKLRPGDRILVDTPDGAVRTYRVAETDVVDSRDTYVVSDPDVDALLLVTCYPFDTPVPGGPLRYMVTAERAYALVAPPPVRVVHTAPLPV